MSPVEHYRRGESCLDYLGSIRSDEPLETAEIMCVLVEAAAHFAAAAVPADVQRAADGRVRAAAS